MGKNIFIWAQHAEDSKRVSLEKIISFSYFSFSYLEQSYQIARICGIWFLTFQTFCWSLLKFWFGSSCLVLLEQPSCNLGYQKKLEEDTKFCRWKQNYFSLLIVNMFIQPSHLTSSFCEDWHTVSYFVEGVMGIVYSVIALLG